MKLLSVWKEKDGLERLWKLEEFDHDTEWCTFKPEPNNVPNQKHCLVMHSSMVPAWLTAQ